MGHLKECNERYGADLCRKLKLRLIGGQHEGERFSKNLLFTGFFGRYGFDPLQSRKICRPSCGIFDRYNLHAGSSENHSRRERRKWRLGATELYEHWLAGSGEYERMAAYYSRCPWIGRVRLGLVCLDIDCHSGQDQSEALQTARVIESAIPMVRIYWEPSTSGSGLHGYLLLSWSEHASNELIREDFNRLGRLLGELTSGLAVGCTEARGAPAVFSGREIMKGGTWAKIPRPQTREEAEALLGALSSEVSAAEAIEALEAVSRVEPVRTAKKKNGVCGLGTTLHPNTFAARAEQVQSGDTLLRANQFCSTYLRSFYRKHGRLPDLTVVAEAYLSAGLAIGNSDDRCLSDAYEHFTQSFDLSKSKVGAERFLADASAAVAHAIENNGLVAALGADLIRRRRIYRAMGCKPSTIAKLQILTETKLSALLACIRYELGQGQGTWGKAQSQALMAKVFGLSIDNKEFKAGMRWLRRNRMVRLVSYHKLGKCRTYQVCLAGNNNTTRPEIQEAGNGQQERETESEGVAGATGHEQGRDALWQAQGLAHQTDGPDRPDVLHLVALQHPRSGSVCQEDRRVLSVGRAPIVCGNKNKPTG